MEVRLRGLHGAVAGENIELGRTEYSIHPGVLAQLTVGTVEARGYVVMSDFYLMVNLVERAGPSPKVRASGGIIGHPGMMVKEVQRCLQDLFAGQVVQLYGFVHDAEGKVVLGPLPRDAGEVWADAVWGSVS